MFRQLEAQSFVFRLVLGCMVIIASFLLVPFIFSAASKNTIEAQDISLQYDNSNTSNYDNSNAVTTGFNTIAHEVELTSFQIKDGAKKSTKSATNMAQKVTSSLSKSAVHGSKTTLHGIGKGATYTGTIASNGISLALNLPVNAVNSITKTPFIKSIVRPSEYEEVALIDPNSPELLAALVALPPTTITPQQNTPTDSNTGPIWPISGRITTGFGVPHRPYQATHTGLDISDGKLSGITPIKPFRSGKVSSVKRARGGYGNHVIIDHGNGVSTLYAHLASSSVQVGQVVSITDTIGLEGSTGMSTGTHLHFEIRINGKVANPAKFIGGHP